MTILLFLILIIRSFMHMQTLGENMHHITKHNDSSMLAMHIGYLAVKDWATGLECVGYKYIKAPIIVASNKPTGFSTTWLHKPLTTSQSFTLFKQAGAERPTHNAWKVHMLNPKAPYRSLWSDVALMKSGEFQKSKEEIRVLVSCFIVYFVFIVFVRCRLCSCGCCRCCCVRTDLLCVYLQPVAEWSELEVVAPLGTVTAVGQTVLLVQLDARNARFAKDRRNHLRKEQLSQGVLHRIIKSLGRLMFEEVRTLVCEFMHTCCDMM